MEKVGITTLPKGTTLFQSMTQMASFGLKDPLPKHPCQDQPTIEMSKVANVPVYPQPRKETAALTVVIAKNIKRARRRNPKRGTMTVEALILIQIESLNQKRKRRKKGDMTVRKGKSVNDDMTTTNTMAVHLRNADAQRSTILCPHPPTVCLTTS